MQLRPELGIWFEASGRAILSRSDRDRCTVDQWPTRRECIWFPFVEILHRLVSPTRQTTFAHFSTTVQGLSGRSRDNNVLYLLSVWVIFLAIVGVASRNECNVGRRVHFPVRGRYSHLRATCKLRFHSEAHHARSVGEP